MFDCFFNAENEFVLNIDLLFYLYLFCAFLRYFWGFSSRFLGK
jgi:hypothetical protein